jgi:REP element-mobilizing transposase RayT
MSRLRADFGTGVSQRRSSGLPHRTVVLLARPPRTQIPGGTYHITARGNRRQAIFHDADDRRLFIALLSRVAQRREWRLIAYCLMTNHFHLVIETPASNLSAGMHYLNFTYAQYFNERHSMDGHLFGGRFGSVLVENEDQLAELLTYVAFNPVRAGLCDKPSDWPWSSSYRLGNRFAFAR